MKWFAGHVQRAHDDLGPLDAHYRIDANGRVIARFTANAALELGGMLLRVNREEKTGTLRYRLSADRGSDNMVLESRETVPFGNGSIKTVKFDIVPDEEGMYEIGHQLWTWRAVACPWMHTPGSASFFVPRVVEQFAFYNRKADAADLGRNGLVPLMLAWETEGERPAPRPGDTGHPDARSIVELAAEVIANQLTYCRSLGFDVPTMLRKVMAQDCMYDGLPATVTDSAEIAEAIGAALGGVRTWWSSRAAFQQVHGRDPREWAIGLDEQLGEEHRECSAGVLTDMERAVRALDAIGAAAPEGSHDPTEEQIGAVVTALGHDPFNREDDPWTVGCASDIDDLIARADAAGVACTRGVTAFDSTGPDFEDLVLTVDLPDDVRVRLASLTIDLKSFRAPEGASSADAVRIALARIQAERDQQIADLTGYLNTRILAERLLSQAEQG